MQYVALPCLALGQVFCVNKFDKKYFNSHKTVHCFSFSKIFLISFRSGKLTTRGQSDLQSVIINICPVFVIIPPGGGEVT